METHDLLALLQLYQTQRLMKILSEIIRSKTKDLPRYSHISSDFSPATSEIIMELVVIHLVSYLKVHQVIQLVFSLGLRHLKAMGEFE